MLVLRLKPLNKRKHLRKYRVAVAEKYRHVTKKSVEDIGWYDPYLKKLSIRQDRLNYYLALNIDISDTLRSILKKNSLIS